MSYARSLVEDAVRAATVEAVPAVTWIMANQGGDSPARPYGTLYVTSSTPLGMGEAVTSADSDPNAPTLVETMREVFDVSVSINSYTGQTKNDGAHVEAVDVLASVVTHLRRPSTAVRVEGAVCLGFLGVSLIRDLSALPIGARGGIVKSGVYAGGN